MTQPEAPSVPPGTIACTFCHQPIVGKYFQFGLRTICSNCAGQLESLRDRNTFNLEAWLRGAAVGLVAAVGGGFAWALVAKATHYELGILAVGIGWIVCAAVRKASGGRRGRSMQALAIALAIIGIIAGKVLTLVLIVSDRVGFANALFAAIRLALTEPQEFFGFFDLIWIAIAVMAPFRVFKRLNIELRGPFDQAGGQAQHLQFDRVEPGPPPASGSAGGP